MKNIVLSLALSAILFSSIAVEACPQCRPVVKAGVYTQNFSANLFVLLLPIAVLLAIGFGIYFSDRIKAKLSNDKEAEPWQTTYNVAP